MPGPHFFTFYSFKGGVGRSMSLLNCAALIAGSGRRVLMIDLDLEAPGLTYLIRELMGDNEATGSLWPQDGLAELIAGFVDDPAHWDLGDPDHPENLNRYLMDLAIPDALRAVDTTGRLCLLPAGRLDDGYAGRLGRLRESAFKELREPWGLHLRGVIQALDAFDYVLIDARTGYSDEGYLAVRVLADHLVVLSGLNNQNLHGTANFLRQLQVWNQADGNPGRRVLLVASPVPEWEDDAKDQRRQVARKIFRKELGVDLGFSHELPYHPRLALEELKVVDCLPKSGLARAYRELAEMLRGLVADRAQDWANRVSNTLVSARASGRTEAESTSWIPELQHSLTELRPLDPGLFQTLAASAVDALDGSERLDDVSSLLEWLSSVLPDDIRILSARIYWLRSRDAFAAARLLHDLFDLAREITDSGARRAALTRTVDLAEQLGAYTVAYAGLSLVKELLPPTVDSRDLAWTLHRLCRVSQLIGQVEPAREYLHAALSIFRQCKDHRGIAFSLNSLASLHKAQGLFDAARHGFNKSIQIAEENKIKGADGTALIGLAGLDLLLGNYIAARDSCVKFIAIRQDLGIEYAAAKQQVLALLDWRQGAYDEARRGLDEVFQVARGLGRLDFVAHILDDLAAIDFSQRNYVAAERGFEQASVIFREVGALFELLDSQIAAAASRSLANPDANLQDLREKVAQAQAQENPVTGINAHLLLTECLTAREDFAAAESVAAEVVTKAAALGLRGYAADARAWRAVALDALGRREDAQAEAGQALAFFRSQEVKAHPLMERLLALSEDHAPA